MKVVLCYSGGLDSTVLLYRLRAHDYEVLPVTVDYGQRHNKELQSAVLLAPELEMVHIKGEVMKKNSLTTEMPVPDGHYADESMKKTVVPNRNMVLIALAGAYAVTAGADAVMVATHAGDHAIYPDCRPEFLEAMNSAMVWGTYEHVSVLAPFQTVTKARIVKLGALYDVPFQETWSCYKGGELHCGTCGTCVERQEAFRDADVYDPTPYMVTV